MNLKKYVFSIIIGWLLLVGCGVNEDVKNEMNDISEEIRNELLNTYPENVEDIEMIEISDISYLINKVEKVDGIEKNSYKIVCSWEVNVSDSFLTEEGQRKTLYNDIEYGYKQSENHIFEVELTLTINEKTYTSARDVENHENHVQCKVCDRYFNKDSENAKSIRKTNMCTQCYKNYKDINDALKELPVN